MNTYSVAVQNVHNSSQLVTEGSVLDENNTSDLDKASVKLILDHSD